MEVILLERLGRIGQIGDTVRVKDGFARNYLLPRHKALRANKANKERFERERHQIEARNLELKTEAAAIAEKLDGQKFIVIRQAGELGQLYGSVSSRDIADLIEATGFTLARNQVALDAPIKTIGLHTVTITLHPEVSSKVVVNVARSADEAERQARGEEVLTRDVDTFEREVGPITDEDGYGED